MLPSRRPERTKVHKNRALRTHFQKVIFGVLGDCNQKNSKTAKMLRKLTLVCVCSQVLVRP